MWVRYRMTYLTENLVPRASVVAIDHTGLHFKDAFTFPKLLSESR